MTVCLEIQRRTIFRRSIRFVLESDLLVDQQNIEELKAFTLASIPDQVCNKQHRLLELGVMWVHQVYLWYWLWLRLRVGRHGLAVFERFWIRQLEGRGRGYCSWQLSIGLAHLILTMGIGAVMFVEAFACCLKCATPPSLVVVVGHLGHLALRFYGGWCFTKHTQLTGPMCELTVLSFWTE